MSDSPPVSSSQRRRGGKRAQRAKRSSAADVRIFQALELLIAVKAEHLDVTFDPDGIWGVSDVGRVMLAGARRLLDDAAVDGSEVAVRAVRRLGDFTEEEDGWGYVTERSEAFLDEVIGGLGPPPA